MNDGVSVIICCYNSVKRLPATLQSLALQNVADEIKWEIIVVDNASNDDTALEAKRIWEAINPKPAVYFSVVSQPVPGLVYARKKGISAASYNYLLFCDDDNWLFKNYVQDVYHILKKNPSYAACGGRGIPVFEIREPEWFRHYAEAYAVGPQSINEEGGVLLNLYGAGMVVNKTALQFITEAGFSPLMKGRTGKQLSSAEDTELSYAFVIAGYSLYYSADLKFCHYLTAPRLQFDYLKKLFVAFGTDGPYRNLYYAYISARPFHKQLKNWSFHFIIAAVRLVKYFITPPKKYGRFIYLRWSIAYIKQLCTMRKEYAVIKGNIEQLKQRGNKVIKPGESVSCVKQLEYPL